MCLIFAVPVTENNSHRDTPDHWVGGDKTIDDEDTQSNGVSALSVRAILFMYPTKDDVTLKFQGNS